jgi:hypothetical protein
VREVAQQNQQQINHAKRQDRDLAQVAFDQGMPNPFPKGSRPFHMYCELVAAHRNNG